MKIEKGKLYYDTIKEEFFKCKENQEYAPATNKIAVHCPTKEDWDYVIEKYKVKGIDGYWEFYEEMSYIAINCETFGSIKSNFPNNHIITIDQFKEFYPESVTSNKTDDNDPINPTHYNQYAIQPLDYIEANGFDFCEGNVIKYVSRYKQKNGLEDLKKARVYLDKLINRYER